jgi:hypothetical protein
MGLWPFGKKIRQLSDELSRELLKTFGIESEDTAAMRYVSRRGRLGTGQVNRVCIFNPAVLSGTELAAGTYESLMALKKGLLFTGHIMKGPENSNTNVVVLYDQRAM